MPIVKRGKNIVTGLPDQRLLKVCLEHNFIQQSLPKEHHLLKLVHKLNNHTYIVEDTKTHWRFVPKIGGHTDWYDFDNAIELAK